MKIKWAAEGLAKLKPNTAGSVALRDGSIVSVGVIRIEDRKLVFFTGKGLRELWGQNKTEAELANAERLHGILKEQDGEEQLIRSGHIAQVALADIVRVLP